MVVAVMVGLVLDMVVVVLNIVLLVLVMVGLVLDMVVMCLCSTW